MISQNLRQKFKFSKSLKNIDKKYILCCGKFNLYLGCESPQEIIQFAQLYGQDNCIAEVNQNCTHINCFFDFDLKEKKLNNDEQLQIKNKLKDKIQEIFQSLKVLFYVKDASNNLQTSLHFILRIYTQENQPVYFRNKTQIDQFFKFINLQKPFDVDAHKGFCLRTLYADKYNNDNQLVGRPFKKSFMSDQQGDLQSLICYCPDQESSLYIDDYVKKQFIVQYAHELNFEKDYSLEQVKKRSTDNHLSLQLTEQKCHNREHNSNNCVIMLFNDNVTVKCHDEACKSLVQPLNVGQFEIIKLDQTPSDKLKLSKEQENVMNAHNEIAQTKEQTGSDVDSITQLEKGGFKALIKYPQFSGLDQELRQLLGSNGIVQHTLSNGQTIEFAQSSKLQQALQRLDKTYSHDEICKIVQVYNQYNININVQQNFYGNQEDSVSGRNLTELFDSCISKVNEQNLIQLDQNIIQNIEDFVIKGAKVRCFENMILNLQKNKFIMHEKDLYYYDREFNKWDCNNGIMRGQGQIRNIISEFLYQIQIQITNQNDKIAQKLYQKISDVSMKQIDNIPYQTYLYILEIKGHEFDQTTTFLHFKQNTYDLLKHQFVQPNIYHYNTLALKYDLSDQLIKNLANEKKQLNNVIQDILPNEKIRKWFLYSIAQNLVVVSKQKPIIFMKGVGSNGKSVLIQLIRNTLGPYCFKGSSTIFQKDSIQDHNKATGTLEDTICSRICYIEELSSNVISIEKLKEYTGGGLIPVRKNNKDFKEKEIKCQFYIACNNIPNFGNNVDQAIKNRILAVPFDTEFTEEPIEEHQRKKIENIANYAKDQKYQQAFMSILLEQLKEPQQIPEDVQLFSQELKEDIDPTIDKFEEHFKITYNDRNQNNELYYITKDDFRKFAGQILKINIPKTGKDQVVGKFKQWLESKKALNEDVIKLQGKATRVYYGVQLLQ